VDSPFIVGIDLGTTNSALAQVDAQAVSDRLEATAIDVRRIPQLVEPGEVGEPVLLPSFLYVPGDVDFPAGSLALPWDEAPAFVVGELARKRGGENPVRLVSSAKSWLSYAGVDRSAAILPWQAPDEVRKLSPVDVTAQYLQHLRAAWDATTGEDGWSLADQDIILTVPASFDEEARELTLSAAQRAGLRHVTLLEEPQAAFYAWIASQGDWWRDRVRVGDLILVCDIGGGTTDFSLITVSEEGGELALRRVAVGEHILLGGDNMDLALARLLQERLEAGGHRIDTWQLQALWHQCRVAKEKLFGEARTKAQPVTIRGRGTRLVGGTIKTELTREDVTRTLVDGFFPVVPSDALPARQRRVGFQELGLPYAPDPAVTRHLARFLGALAGNSPDAGAIRRGPSGLACPTRVLFNGGVMKAGMLRSRIVDVLSLWLEREGFAPLAPGDVLDAPDLDLAVARGAAYYGAARRGRGLRIHAGAPRTYYVGIESAMPAVPGIAAPLKALCVVPFGMEEGSASAIPDREFGLVVGEPAEFRFLSSTARKQDSIGSLIEDWHDEIDELTPLEVTLSAEGQEGAMLPVRLESHVTETGVLELWCVARDGRRWKLERVIRERAASPEP
jgi:actin-like ATPase involved in cell morphogenesis